jgi:hypothetical protein
LDPYIVYARPVGSVGSLLWLYETCSFSWITMVFMRDM